MRTGLLTRFLGILGMLSAALAILSQFLFSFVLTFWLISLGLLCLNRGPGGAPPAWRTGKAEPWPNQRELAAARRDAAQKNEPARVAAPTTTAPHSATSKKRKRKRRD
jgi:hypothetical protein